MSRQVVILGVSERDFFNRKIFDKVVDENFKDLKLFKDIHGKEYIGIEVKKTKKGRATMGSIFASDQKFREQAFGALSKIQPKLFDLEVI